MAEHKRTAVTDPSAAKLPESQQRLPKVRSLATGEHNLPFDKNYWGFFFCFLQPMFSFRKLKSKQVK